MAALIAPPTGIFRPLAIFSSSSLRSFAKRITSRVSYFFVIYLSFSFFFMPCPKERGRAFKSFRASMQQCLRLGEDSKPAGRQVRARAVKRVVWRGKAKAISEKRNPIWRDSIYYGCTQTPPRHISSQDCWCRLYPRVSMD